MLVGLQRDGRQRQSVGRSQAKIKRWRGSLSRCTLGWQIESSIKAGKKKRKNRTTLCRLTGSESVNSLFFSSFFTLFSSFSDVSPNLWLKKRKQNRGEE